MIPRRPLKLVVTGIALTALLALPGCLPPSETIETSACRGEIDLAGLTRTGGPGPWPLHEVVLHPGEDGDLRSQLTEQVQASAFDGATLRVSILNSSSASSRKKAGPFRFAGTSVNTPRTIREVEPMADTALCEILTLLDARGAPSDKGADLAGSVELAIRGASETDDFTITLLTDGGIHRTDQLDLGSLDTTPLDWEITVERLREAARSLPDDHGVRLTVVGIGETSGDAAPHQRVIDQTFAFWNDVCTALGSEGVSC